jgi:pSer/pThr/pTyr-binding forkhead associated (FHA) protein
MLDRDSIDIGRSSAMQLQLNHPEVSRHHANLVKDGDFFTITDLDSTAGTWVNNVKLQPFVPLLVGRFWSIATTCTKTIMPIVTSWATCRKTTSYIWN